MTADDYAGFLTAARTGVHELQRLLGFELWTVSCVDRSSRPQDVHRLLAAVSDGEPGPVPDADEQVVLAAAGPLAAQVAVGTRVPWSQALCRPLVDGDGPWFVPDVTEVPAYAAVTGPVPGPGPVGSYVGSRLRRADGSVIGTLSGYGRAPLTDRSPQPYEHVHLVATLLSALLDAEERVAGRDRELVLARAVAEHDALTGVLNRRGWDRALAREQERIGRYGSTASIVVVDLDELKATNDRHGHAHGDALLCRAVRAMAQSCRPSDVVARLGGDEFAVLAVEADILAGRALAARLARDLRSAGVRASVGVAARRVGEDLLLTCERADAAMGSDKRRRRVGRAG